MTLIGRYARTRPLGPQGWGYPYILDRKWGRLSPCAGEEWVRLRSGMWLPVPRGGVGLLGSQQSPRLNLGVNNFNSGAATDIALDSAYTNNSAGDVIAVGTASPIARTISKVYFYYPSYGGSAASVTTVNLEIRLDSIAGGTLVASNVIDPASATGWIAHTGLSAAMAAMTRINFLAADADGNGTNFIRVRRSVSNLGTDHDYRLAYARSSTAGFASSTTFVADPGVFVLVFSTGASFGQPFSDTITKGTTNVTRGLYLSGFTAPVSIYGAVFGPVTSSQGATGLQVWAGSTGPSGTPYASGTGVLEGTGTGADNNMVILDGLTTLDANTAYRIVFLFAGATTTLRAQTCGTSAPAEVRAAMLGGGSWYYTQDTSGSWADDVDSWPFMYLLIEDMFSATPPAGGGIGKSRIIGGV